MKKISSPGFILLFFLFQATECISQIPVWPVRQAWIPAYLHAIQVQQNDELVVRNDSNTSDVYDNPLLLNGKLLDYNKFTLSSKGLLSVVTGNPENPEAKRIPFKIMLRRGGKIVIPIDIPEGGLYIIDISKILAVAKPGDQLIIDPVNPDDWKAKRILYLLDDGC